MPKIAFFGIAYSMFYFPTMPARLMERVCLGVLKPASHKIAERLY